jgi:peptidoglycan hydrolase CwlO-like protein
MRTHPFPTPRCRRRRVLTAALCILTALTGCLRNPVADAATAQALTQIADQVGAMQQDNAELQNQVDSLRTVVARQDTVVRRLANLAGVPMVP